MVSSDKHYCVYKHTSPHGKVYIGITGQDPKIRWGHGSHYGYNKRFINAIRKYGWENFKHEILFSGLSHEDAMKEEIKLIAQYDSTNREKGYNVDLGGHSRPTGENNPLFGIKRDPAVVEKIAAKRRGKPWSEAMRKAREEYHKNNKPHNFGKKASDETRRKLSFSHMGQCRPHDEQTILKIRASQPNKKTVIQIKQNGETCLYPSVAEAARTIGNKKCIKENIRQCCRGMKKTAYGFVWRYQEEVDMSCMTFNKSNQESTA